jgi:hypothetical protein
MASWFNSTRERELYIMDMDTRKKHKTSRTAVKSNPHEIHRLRMFCFFVSYLRIRKQCSTRLYRGTTRLRDFCKGLSAASSLAMPRNQNIKIRLSITAQHHSKESRLPCAISRATAPVTSCLAQRITLLRSTFDPTSHALHKAGLCCDFFQ